MCGKIIENKEKPGYYEILGFSDYIVNREGKVYNKRLAHFLDGSTNPAGYVNYRLKDDSGYTYTFGRHRLLLFVFKYPGEIYKDLVSNHKNALKGDDRLDNLEWLTATENLEHAQTLGLMSFSLKISVKDCITGKIKDYKSIAECSRELNLSKDAIGYRVKSNGNRVFPELKQYRLKSDLPWKTPNNYRFSASMYGNKKSLRVRDVVTGEVYFYEKQNDFCLEAGISPACLTQRLSLKGQPVFPGFVQLKRADDNSEWRDIDDRFLELEKTTGSKCVVITSSVSNDVKIFTSVSEASKKMGILNTTLLYRLNNKIKKTCSKNFYYYYYSDFKKL